MTTDSKAAGAPPASEPQSAAAAGWSPLRTRSGSDIRRFAAVGTGVGIEIRDGELHVSIVKLRPWETGVLGSATVPDFRNRPAAEWGGELSSFLRKAGVGHIAATILLPRSEVIVRQVQLPGVSDRDLPAAIGLQVDSLHPFADDDVYFSWARIGKTPSVLVGMARRDTIDTYWTLFGEAGLKIAAFTFSAAVLYSASRLITVPAGPVVAYHETKESVEVYGESPAKPLYSASLPVSADRAIAVGRSELRLDPDVPAVHVSEILPKPALFPPNHDPQSNALELNAMPYATALAGACPWLAIEGNLLPAERRRSSSRVRLIPTFTLAATLALLLIALALRSSYADARYLGVLQHEIARYQPAAKRVEAIDRAITITRSRSQALDDFRRRSKLDMDALAEITKLIPPPGWLATMEMDRNTLQVNGEVDQAAPLLNVLDKSPLFEKSEFSMPINRTPTGENFRIRTQRTEPPLVPANAGKNAGPVVAQPQAKHEDSAKKQDAPQPQPGAAKK